MRYTRVHDDKPTARRARCTVLYAVSYIGLYSDNPGKSNDTLMTGITFSSSTRFSVPA